jgi:hypothetical protein
MKHPQHDILIAIADGHTEFQKQYHDSPTWHNIGLDELLIDLGQHRNVKHRIKPKTISINGVECPKNVEYNDQKIAILRNGSGRIFYFATEADAHAVFEALVNSQIAQPQQSGVKQRTASLGARDETTPAPQAVLVDVALHSQHLVVKEIRVL